MSDDVRKVVRSEETLVAGDPPQQVVTQTTAGGVVPVVPAAPVAPVVPAATVQQTTMTPPGDRMVAHTEAVSDINPAEEKAANIGWLNSIVWFIAGLLIALLAIRFILAMTGASPDAG